MENKNKSKIIVICGNSGAGKDTLLKGIIKAQKETYTHWKSETTRNPRYGERQGLEYFFVPLAEFTKNLYYGNYIAKRILTTDGNSVFYGLNKSFFKPEGKKYVTILDYNGIKNMLKMYGQENVITIYLTADKKELARRITERDSLTAEQIAARLSYDDHTIPADKPYNMVIDTTNIPSSEILEDVLETLALL
jgi:guanylate kinase